MAVKKGFIAENPIKGVKSNIRLDDSATHVALSKKEARKLLSAVDTTSAKGKRDYALLMFLIHTGVRRSECVAVKLADIVSEQEHRVLVVEHGKGNKRRKIPIRPDVFRSIVSYLEATGRMNDSPDAPLFTRFYKGNKATNMPITDKALCNIVKGYAKKARITATTHDLRSTAITFWFDTGANIAVIQRLAGHSSPTTTQGYYTRRLDLDNSPVYRVTLED